MGIIKRRQHDSNVGRIKKMSAAPQSDRKLNSSSLLGGFLIIALYSLRRTLDCSLAAFRRGIRD